MSLFTRQGQGQGRALLLLAAAVFVIGAVCVADVAAQAASASGTFTDKRDGKTYKTVKVGNQVWMAQNMDYKTGKSWCYGNVDANCKKYGRLYDWNTARKACPSGWHLPSQEEWEELRMFIDRDGGNSDDDRMSGNALKSVSGWNKGGNGIDKYGFSGLPGGCGSSGKWFGYIGDMGVWWEGGIETDETWIMTYKEQLLFREEDNERESQRENYAVSVRCISD